MALYHLNEIQGGMLLSGAADGSVRVWRNFSHRGAQRLASAWRVGRSCLPDPQFALGSAPACIIPSFCEGSNLGCSCAYHHVGS